MVKKSVDGGYSLRALPVYPVFENENLKGLDEKMAKQKIALKRPQH